jgi:hypothetical protein
MDATAGDGAPDTPRPGDFSTAWAAGTLDARPEWLILEYADATTLDSVRIYESFNPGAISKVIAFAEDGREVSLVADRSGHGEWTSEFRPAEGQALRVRRVRIDINEPAIPGYNEIDAVGLKGTDRLLAMGHHGHRQFVLRAGCRHRFFLGPKNQDRAHGPPLRSSESQIRRSRAISARPGRPASRMMALSGCSSPSRPRSVVRRSRSINPVDRARSRAWIS